MNYNTNNERKTLVKEYINAGFINIKNKKFRMIVIIILIIITLSLINISDSLFNYNELVIKRHAKLLVTKEEQFIQLEKSKYYNDDEMTINYRSLSNEEINKINKQLKKTNKSTKEIYRIANMHIPSEAIMTEKSIFDILSINEEAYLLSEPYTYRTDEVDIVNWDDFDNFFINDITGRMPKANDEILISNHLAELLIKVGLKSYGEEKYYKPVNFEELISSKKYFHFGDIDKVKIVGIINYNLSDFEEIKNISWDDYNLNMEKNSVLLDELSYRDKNIYNKIFVTDEFIKSLVLNNPNNLNHTMENIIIKTGVLIMENTEKGFFNILNEYKYNSPLLAKSTYSPIIDTVNHYVKLPYFATTLLLTTFILILLSIIFISNLMFSKRDKIKLRNKEINKLMCRKMMLGSSFLILVISTIISCIALIYIFKYIQLIIGGDLLLNPFIISTRLLWISIFSLIIIFIISYLISMIKIKMLITNEEK